MNDATPLVDAGAHRVKALLLAAGIGNRLRPLTDRIPKCLVPVGDRPLLEYWFDALGRIRVWDVLLNTHHHADALRKLIRDKNEAGRFRVTETHEPKLLGSAGTVSANRGWMDDSDDCLVIYADNLSRVDLGALLRFHRSHGDPLTMMLFHAPEPERCGIAEIDEAGRVLSFIEKPACPRSDLANAGVYVLTAAAWREVAGLGAFDLGFDVLPRFVGRMRGWTCDCYHRDIGTPDSLEAAREDVMAFEGGWNRG